MSLPHPLNSLNQYWELCYDEVCEQMIKLRTLEESPKCYLFVDSLNPQDLAL